MDAVEKIIAYESGEMNPEEEVRFFAELIKSGLAWTLQGSYGRMAKAYIQDGMISYNGEIVGGPEAGL